MTAVVQAEQDARRKFDGCGSHAEAGPALKVVQEGLQGLVQDLIRGLGRMDITPARPVAGPGVQLLDAEALQSVLHIVGDSRPVGARHDLGGVGFGRLRRSGRAASNSSSTAAFSAADRASSADLLSLTCVPLFALGRSLLNLVGRAPERGQAGRAQRAELLKGRLRVTGAQRQLRRSRRSRCQPAHRSRRRRVAGASLLPQEPGLGLVPERISFSASSHSISAPSAWPLRTASSTRPSAR